MEQSRKKIATAFSRKISPEGNIFAKRRFFALEYLGSMNLKFDF